MCNFLLIILDMISCLFGQKFCLSMEIFCNIIVIHYFFFQNTFFFNELFNWCFSAEGTGQNFVDEDLEENTNVASPSKMLRIAEGET